MKLTPPPLVIALLLSLIINSAVFAEGGNGFLIIDRKEYNREKLVYGRAKGQTINAACDKAEQKARLKLDKKLAKRGRVLREAVRDACGCSEDDNNKWRCTVDLRYELEAPVPVVGNNTLD